MAGLNHFSSTHLLKSSILLRTDISCYLRFSLLALKFLFIYLKQIIFWKKGREGERKGEKQGWDRGTWPCNPGMFPDWESTSYLSVRRPALNPLSHTGQGSLLAFLMRRQRGSSPFFRRLRIWWRTAFSASCFGDLWIEKSSNFRTRQHLRWKRQRC